MERRLAAILAADVVGYSRLMGDDEIGTLAALTALRGDVIEPLVATHRGRIVKLLGDGFLVEFPSVVDAVACAIAWQGAMAEQTLCFRIGVNLGDIILEDGDIYGNGVNVAARLEGLAEPGGICVSGTVHGEVKGKLEAAFEDLGEQRVKNIAEPVRTYRVVLDGAVGAAARTTAEILVVAEQPTIAVLPFTNMSGDSEQEYFSDGITEDLITELSRFRELLVIARNSSFAYKGKAVKVQDIGRDLGAAYLVEGSVRKAGSRVRVTAQLVETASGNHLWAERYDRELEDIFAVQDEITRAIVTGLPIRLQSALLETARQKPTESLSAYDCVLRGRWIHDQTSGQDRSAVKLFEKAIELDPRCAMAYGQLANVYAYSLFSLNPIGANPADSAREMIEQALAITDDDYGIHTVAADVYLMCGQHHLAKRHSDRALALNPNHVHALVNRGFLECYMGDAALGADLQIKALGLAPNPPDYFYEMLAEAYYMLAEYEKAIAIYTRWRNPPPHMYTHLAACHAQLGHMDQARAAAETFQAMRPKDADFGFYAAAHARLCMRKEDAEHWLDGYRKAGLLT